MGKNHKFWTNVKNTSLIILGTLILAFGISIFILPFNLVTGGISGIAIVIDLLVPIEAITVDMIVTVLTWLLFFVGLFFLGKDFAMKTLISTIIYPPAVSFFLKLASPDVLDGFFCLDKAGYSEITLIIAATVGGLCVGTGCAITFLGGGSTGGVDIFAFAICKYFKRAKSSVVIFLIDAAAVIFGMFVIGDLVITLLGVFSAFLTAAVIDKIFLKGSRALIANIVSDKHLEINQAIIERLGRTTTIFDAIGGYSKEDKKMIMVSFTMSQYAALMAIINEIDHKAFITIHNAREINGEGWTR